MINMITKERLSAGLMPSWVRFEHAARFDFARLFVGGKNVVDAACGSGAGAVIFASHGARQVSAYDLSSSAIDEAKSKYVLPNLSFAVADVRHLPIAANAAEVFVSLETIEHLSDDVGLLSEVSRVLSDDGVFIVSTPNRRVTNPGAAITDRPFNPFHVREYEMGEFHDLLKKYFRSVEMFGQNPQHRWRVDLMVNIGQRFSPRIAARVNQLLKIPRLFIGQKNRHAVESCRADQVYEYLIAVCKK